MISAKQNIGIEELKTNYCLLSIPELYAIMRQSLLIQDYDSLLKALEVTKVKYGLETNLPSDLMAIDIKDALYHFGMITGQVTNDEL
jgi:tRNA modification GTPase